MSKAKPKPLKKIKVGRIDGTVWKNQSARGDYYSISFQRRYKDKETGEFKTVTSFSQDDLTDLIAAAEMIRGILPVLERPPGEEE